MLLVVSKMIFFHRSARAVCPAFKLIEGFEFLQQKYTLDFSVQRHLFAQEKGG